MITERFSLNICSFVSLKKIGTKSVKQCIEFYYMPKLCPNLSKISSQNSSNGFVNKRKQYQMKSKQQKLLREPTDEETSSPLNNEIRPVRE